MAKIGDVKFFDRFARFYDTFALRPNTKILEDVIGDDAELVLDIAGGTGRISRELRDGSDIRPVVLDASTGMLKQAEGFDRVRANAYKLPFSDDSFDAAVCVDAIHHIRDVASVFIEARRVVKDGGVFAVIDFSPRTIRGKLLGYFEHFFRLQSFFYTPEEVVRLLEGAEMEAEITRRGFEYVVVGEV